MEIKTVRYREHGGFKVNETVDGDQIFVPDNMENSYRVMIQEWIDAGNTPDPYVAPELNYVDKRVIDYPRIGDQMDMLWHAIDEETLDKTSDFYITLKAVKDKHPKE